MSRFVTTLLTQTVFMSEELLKIFHKNFRFLARRTEIFYKTFRKIRIQHFRQMGKEEISFAIVTNKIMFACPR